MEKMIILCDKCENEIEKGCRKEDAITFADCAGVTYLGVYVDLRKTSFCDNNCFMSYVKRAVSKKKNDEDEMAGLNETVMAPGNKDNEF